ncbi:ATP-binding protein [Actinosynnema sp. NPDC059797]
MVESAQAVHRTIVVVDVEGFGDPRRTLPHQVATRAGLYRVVADGLQAAGVPWGDCYHEDRGDGVFVLVEPRYAKTPLVEVLPTALVRALRAHNDISPAAQQVRLRLAVHAGEVVFDRHGVTSTAVTTAFRLLDALPVKRALADSLGLVALVVSRWVFDEVVRHSAVLDPATFRPFEVTVKEVRETVWIALPDHPYPADSTVLDRLAKSVAPDYGGRVPRQLPVAPASLVGRNEQLRWLEAAVDIPTADAVVVAVIAGTAGVGKTALALHWGHRNRDRFPDGELFVDLRGFSTDTETVDPGVVIHDFLLALGIKSAAIPSHTDARIALFRSMTADRRMLVVLDNAADEAQLRPLLATGAGSLVLVTSRQVLGGMEAQVRLRLEVLTPGASMELLASIASRERVACEPAEALQVVELCGRLPLALRIAGNRLAARPGWTVKHLADRLRDQRRRLSALTSGDLRVRTAFEMSYRQLNGEAAMVFRRLSLVPGADFTPQIAATLSAMDRSAAEEVLEELVDMSLLDTAAVPGRYLFHDLIRVFASERLAEEEPARLVERATRRMATWLLSTATTAAQFFGPDARQTPSGPLGGFDDADTWLAAETANWLGALRWATTTGMHTEVLALATAVHWYSDQRGHGQIWEQVFTAGVAAARALNSTRDEAVQLNFLTWTLAVLLRRYHDALTLHDQAWRAALTAGDTREQAWAMFYRAITELRLGQLEQSQTSAQRARQLFGEADYPLGGLICSIHLGQVLYDLRRHNEAVELYQRLVATVRSGQFKLASTMRDEMTAVLLVRIGDNLVELGRWMEVLEAVDEATDLARKTHAMSTQSDAGYLRGLALHRLGRLSEAKISLEQTLNIVTEQPYPRSARVLDALAQLCSDLGDPDGAERYRTRAAGTRPTSR